MKVLLVNGSSHPNGCTDAALTEIARSLQEESIETEIYFIGNKPMSEALPVTAAVPPTNASLMTV